MSKLLFYFCIILYFSHFFVLFSLKIFKIFRFFWFLVKNGVAQVNDNGESAKSIKSKIHPPPQTKDKHCPQCFKGKGNPNNKSKAVY